MAPAARAARERREAAYTRGDWTTVEKWPGCVEATNRYELGAAQPAKDDTVWAWADVCGG